MFFSASLATFKQSGIRGVWLRISIDNSSFIPIAIKVQSSKLRGSEIAVTWLKKMSFTYPFQDVKAIKTIKAAVLHSPPSHFILLLFFV